MFSLELLWSFLLILNHLFRTSKYHFQPILQTCTSGFANHFLSWFREATKLKLRVPGIINKISLEQFGSVSETVISKLSCNYKSTSFFLIFWSSFRLLCQPLFETIFLMKYHLFYERFYIINKTVCFHANLLFIHSLQCITCNQYK